jgi:hypothetical protein
MFLKMKLKPPNQKLSSEPTLRKRTMEEALLFTQEQKYRLL